ncbi:alpha/beta hydrolase [Patescibacteria group bacterium]|nr:alpha/beta hydrolase [Patescibacteria group bacterium]MBU1672847.1 alpha/beta hydrolase [Patescibacteria group bacterium]MBU1963732.1 alpha/beta hydrolase [Patescibacteria group bacterium]
MSHRGENLKKREKQKNKSRFGKIFGIILAILFGLIIFLLLIGWFMESRNVAADQELFSPAGEIYKVNSQDMHLYCTGEGSPIILLESGMGGSTLDWRYIQSELSQYSKVCSFDRPGYGWSEPSSIERTAQQMSDELHLLMHQINETEGPFIIAGYSLGGLNARLFTKNHGNEVMGMVLVDSAHEDLDARSPDQVIQLNSSLDTIFQLFQTAAKFGLIRLAGIDSIAEYAPFISADIPNDIKEEYEAELARSQHWETMRQELESQDLSARQAREIENFGDTPLIIIRAGQIAEIPQLSESENQEYRDAQISVQEDLAAMSTNSELLVAEESDHDILFKQPQIVIDAILKLLP